MRPPNGLRNRAHSSAGIQPDRSNAARASLSGGLLLDRSLQQPLVVDDLRGGDRDAGAADHGGRGRPEAGRAPEFRLTSCRVVHQKRHNAWLLVGAAASRAYSPPRRLSATHLFLLVSESCRPVSAPASFGLSPSVRSDPRSLRQRIILVLIRLFIWRNLATK